MENKKANTLGIFLIVGFIIVFLAGVGIGIFIFINRPQVAIFTTSNSYVCPENYGCSAQAVFECVTTTGEQPIVIARTDDFDYSSGWIAYDNGFGGLNSYAYSTSLSDENIQGERTLIILPLGAEGFFAFDERGCQDQNCLYVIREPGKFYRYNPGGTGDINPEPQSDCQNKELCSGTTQRYNCVGKDVTLNGEIVQTLSWNSNEPTPEGGFKGQEIFLAGGDVLEYNGVIEVLTEEKQEVRLTTCITSNGKEIDVGDSICTSDTSLEICVAGELGENPSPEPENAIGRKICIESSPGNAEIKCSTSECLFDGIGRALDDKSGYYTCDMDEQGCFFINFNNIVSCENGELFDEVELKCKPPYGFSFTLDNTNLGTEDFVVGNVVISAEERDQILIEVKILDADDRSEIRSNSFLTIQGTRLFTFNPLPIGNYIVQGTSKHPLGEQTKEVTIKVTSQISTSLSFPVGVDFTQFSNNPIVVRATARDGSQLADVARWDVNAFINDRPIAKDKILIDLVQGKSQVDIKTTVNEAGELRYEIVAVTPSGFRTELETVRITVKKSNIIIPVDISSANNQETGTYTISFQTLNNDNQLVNTDGSNEVTITLPNTCKSGEFCTQKNKVIINPTVQGTNGIYSFLWTFEDAGLYVVEVSSSAEGFDVSKSTPTSVNIRADATTDAGQTNTIWIVAGVLGLVVLFIIGFIIWRVVRK